MLDEDTTDDSFGCSENSESSLTPRLVLGLLVDC